MVGVASLRTRFESLNISDAVRALADVEALIRYLLKPFFVDHRNHGG
jgi:hypothetical protein